MSWMKVVKEFPLEVFEPSPLAHLRQLGDTDVEPLSSDDCCDEVKQAIHTRIQTEHDGWIEWYVDIMTDDGDEPLDSMSCLDLKNQLDWAIGESHANTYIHSKPARDTGVISDGDKAHELVNPFFTRMLAKISEDCPDLELEVSGEVGNTAPIKDWTSQLNIENTNEEPD